MYSEIYILSLTAATIAFIHTLFGPDHYLPFVVLSKARKWSTARTVWMTILCGIGHVGSSVLIGIIGIAAGIALSKLNYFESVRGNIAGWLFIAFGLVYALWGLRRAYKNKPHTHAHIHLNGKKHVHEHTHSSEHTHVHEQDEDGNLDKIEYKSLTPWILFVIFVFGPCEPLIPLVMFPAMRHNVLALVSVTVVFSLVTILTMLLIVMLMSSGLQMVKLEKLDKFTHALAGTAIFFSGVAIQFLGL
jgi:ABC-type nickel/cobalt efflux system permease component RcnA